MNNYNSKLSSIDTSQQTIITKKFSLRHSFRAGAIVWAKDKNTGLDYYMVFKSFSRPMRGIQLPGGRVEKLENVADTVIREVEEETGVKTNIVCPLGLIYLNNPSKSYSRVEIYYIVRPIYSVDVRRKWHHTDTDKSAQNLECWYVPVNKTPIELAAGQDQVLEMFRQWLKEHQRINFSPAENSKYAPILGFENPSQGNLLPRNNPNERSKGFSHYQNNYNRNKQSPRSGTYNRSNLVGSIDQSLDQISSQRHSTNSWRNNSRSGN